MNQYFVNSIPLIRAKYEQKPEYLKLLNKLYSKEQVNKFIKTNKFPSEGEINNKIDSFYKTKGKGSTADLAIDNFINQNSKKDSEIRNQQNQIAHSNATDHIIKHEKDLDYGHEKKI